MPVEAAHESSTYGIQFRLVDIGGKLKASPPPRHQNAHRGRHHLPDLTRPPGRSVSGQRVAWASRTRATAAVSLSAGREVQELVGPVGVGAPARGRR